jgi:hypothetical protein
MDGNYRKIRPISHPPRADLAATAKLRHCVPPVMIGIVEPFSQKIVITHAISLPFHRPLLIDDG